MLISFDLEIFKEVQGDDWQSQRPLGISCLAFMAEDGGSYVFNGEPGQAMTHESLGDVVDYMLRMAEGGDTFVTVNGTGFDFDILAEESERFRDCARMAIHNHVDMMLMSVTKYGWRVGLEALAKGARIPGKMKTVTLKDGSTLDGMSGALAPQMWQRGESEAVIAYLLEDARATLEVAKTAVAAGVLSWYTQKGKPLSCPLFPLLDSYQLPTVRELMHRWDHAQPDQSWMDGPDYALHGRSVGDYGTRRRTVRRSDGRRQGKVSRLQRGQRNGVHLRL